MKTRSVPYPWQVLLIGDSSGVGKTVATQQLARHLGVSHLQVDDIRLTLQEFTSDEQYPDLHHLEVAPGTGSLPAEAICSGLIRVGEVLAAPLATIIAHHVVVAGVGPVIIEGDGVTPQLATNAPRQRFRVVFGHTRLSDSESGKGPLSQGCCPQGLRASDNNRRPTTDTILWRDARLSGRL